MYLSLAQPLTSAAARATTITPPTVVDDTATIAFNATGSTGDINVLANDTAGSNPIDSATLTVTSGPSHGTTSIVGGKIRYVPSTNFSGADQLTYRVRDTASIQCQTDGRVSITVDEAPPVAPTAVGDSATCPHDSHVDISVLANDVAGSRSIAPTSVAVASGPSHGTTSLPGGGVIRYTSTLTYAGADTFTYTVADTADLTSNAALVSVTVDPGTPPTPTPPTAIADTASCSFNSFVDINVVSNDVAGTNAISPGTTAVVTSPAHGTAVHQGSGIIRYTPTTGYSGSDSFTYTVADGSSHTSNAALVSITVAANPNYTNGYLYRSRFRVPRALLQTALADVIVTYDRTATEFKTTSHTGGQVTSSTGGDIRFEDNGGTKLKHRLVKYDGATGRVRAYLLIPATTADVDYGGFVYVGKASASEEDAAGLYANTISAHNCQTGADLSGGGRNFTMTGVTAGTALEESAQFDGSNSTGLYSAAGLSAYYGLDKITIELWADPAAADIGTDHGLVCLGPSQGDAFSNHTFVLSLDQQGFYGLATNVITGTIRIGDDSMRIESAANVQAASIQHLALKWKTGNLPQLLINGVATVPTFCGEAANQSSQDGVALDGVTTAPTSGGLRLACGPVGPSTGDFKGQLAELRIYNSRRGSNTVTAEVQSYLDSATFMGFSTFDLSNVNQGPVAVPVPTTCTKGGSDFVNVLPQCFEPDGSSMTIIARTSGAHGTVKIVCPYTSGGTYTILVGDTITGATSGATAVITNISTASGSFAGGDAAGNLRWSTQTGVFQAENINVGANLNVATIDPTAGQVRYDHDNGSSTSDSFTYTISDGSLTSTGKVTVTIPPPVATATDASFDVADVVIGNTIDVTGTSDANRMATLVAQINSLGVPTVATKIRLANGVYDTAGQTLGTATSRAQVSGDTLTISTPATQAAPIIIEALNLHGAKIYALNNIKTTGSNIIFHKLRVESSAFVDTGTLNRISRCRVRDINAVYGQGSFAIKLDPGSTKFRADHNEITVDNWPAGNYQTFVTSKTAKRRSAFHVNTARGGATDAQVDENVNKNWVPTYWSFDSNWVHHTPPKPDGATYGTANNEYDSGYCHALPIGTSSGDSRLRCAGLIFHNIVEDCYTSDGLLEPKISDLTIWGNTLRRWPGPGGFPTAQGNRGKGQFNLRQGWWCTIIANYIKSIGLLDMWGGFQTVAGNTLGSTDIALEMRSGNNNFDDFAGSGSNYVRAYQQQWFENTGKIIIGSRFSSTEDLVPFQCKIDLAASATNLDVQRESGTIFSAVNPGTGAPPNGLPAYDTAVELTSPTTTASTDADKIAQAGTMVTAGDVGPWATYTPLPAWGPGITTRAL
jgi:hypothetical protein